MHITVIEVDSDALKKFVFYITNKQEIPKNEPNLKLLLTWYSHLKEATRSNGKLITDIRKISESFKNLLTGITDREYDLFMNQLTMYEATANASEWPQFKPLHIKERELRDRIENPGKIDPKEKDHFIEERKNLGDAGEDIAGAVVIKLLPEEPLQRKRRRK